MNLQGGTKRAVTADLGDHLVFEEGEQVQAYAVLVALHPFRAAAASGDRFIFFLEGSRGLGEALAGFELAVAVLGAELEVPILGNFLGAGKAALFGALAPFLTFEEGVAVPGTGIGPAVQGDFIAKYLVPFHILIPSVRNVRNCATFVRHLFIITQGVFGMEMAGLRIKKALAKQGLGGFFSWLRG